MQDQQSALAGKKNSTGFILGIGLTLIISLIAKGLATFPFLSIMGQLVLAIMLGMIYRASVGVPEYTKKGIAFSNQKLLRLGIILLGMRLNLTDIVHAGPKVLLLAIINITVTIVIVYGAARLLKVDNKMALLTACGSAICGAAAVVAIAPQIKANEQETAISAATVAILGTLFTLLYVGLYPILGLSPAGYGLFAGSTLHEVAHAIAAAAPGGKVAEDMSVIVKLTRVALLVPVSIFIGIWAGRKEKGENKKKGIPIPWFVLGFLVMSGVNTLGIIPAALTSQVITFAYILIAMAMAGLGLNVDVAIFRRKGIKPFVAGLIGSLILSAMGYGLVILLGLT
ncbi:YeiH family protein [Paenibacillus pini]|uniref:Membrane protein YeiH n=1 Tax=Paenibacillus pini JCM 16418 TaxID=1236976 RepID=W7Z2G2_9BACL|nr:putative sulfate exporter family transporter [Paenibacillus pini]GAF08579.1 membrane protein YeiH [Paenibacillus pini JCM 16418]